MSVSARSARAEAERFVRFCIVGVSNTLLTLVSFEVLAGVGVVAAAASALAFGVGAANGYFLNRSWTFRSRRRGAATVARYVAVQAAGAACSAGGVALASADLSLPRTLAEAGVLPFATVLTYTLSRRLVFAAQPHGSSDQTTPAPPAVVIPGIRAIGPVTRSRAQTRRRSIGRPHPPHPSRRQRHGTASPRSGRVADDAADPERRADGRS